jgi:hypothetical protein
MRKLFAWTLVIASLCVAMLTTLGAHAATHGCISESGVVNVTSGSGGPVNEMTSTCDFTWVDGDTYSGVGPFSISCPLGTGTKTWTHAATDAPVVETALTCNASSTVVITLSPGATVAAGNLM